MKILRYDPRDEWVPINVDRRLLHVRNLLDQKRANPEAVRYSQQQLEDRVARLEAQKSRQARGPNAVVARLLASPTDVLADREQWPHADDLADGADLLGDAYRGWLLNRARDAGGPWENPAQLMAESGPPLWWMGNIPPMKDDLEAVALHWLLRNATTPYPVGRKCWEFADEFPAAAASELMPFYDDAHAAVVLNIPIDGRPVDVFFMGRREPFNVVLEGEWLPGPEPLIIGGTDVRTDPPRPRGFTEVRIDAKRWWKFIAGLSIEPGHRNRQRERSPNHLVEALIAYKAGNGPAPPSRDEFLEYLGIESTQWGRLIRDWETDWDEIRRAVYGHARRPRRIIDHG